MLRRLFARSGTIEPYELFSRAHLFLFIFTMMVVVCMVWHHRHAEEEQVRAITRRAAILLWVLETIKIVYNLLCGNAGNPNTYVPLYFCSIPLFCLPMCGWGRGNVKRLGDVFMVVGGLVGGAVYLITPTTSAGSYSAFHFITLQAFTLHGVMIYISLLYVLTGHYRLKKSDWKYYAATVVTMCFLALVVNYFLGSNLMFVTSYLPGTPVETLYRLSPHLYPIMMTLIQAFPPFVVVYELYQKFVYSHAAEETERKTV